MKFKKRDNLFLGAADLTVGQVGKEIPGFIAGLSMLVTCLDSCSNISSLTRWMEKLDENGIPAVILGSAAWIGAEHVSALFEGGYTFFGFDEVYFYKADSTPLIIPTNIFTSDVCLFPDEVPEEFLDGFIATGAVRYLSSGCGLNFVCESDTLVNQICDLERLTG